jgi:calcineurin-like phosphoesterase family protein
MTETTLDLATVNFVTSDTHFGHARIIELCNRPFGDVDEMNEELVRRWNHVVGADDTVLHLGDLALGEREHSIGLTAALNGRKLVVPGNHDLFWSHYRASAKYKALNAELRPVDMGLPLVHGHTHDTDHGPRERTFHVGIDAHDFTPVPMSTISAWLTRLG